MPEDSLSTGRPGRRTQLNERYCADGSDRFRLPSAPSLESLAGMLDGLGAKSRQTHGIQSPSPGRRDTSYLTTWDAVADHSGTVRQFRFAMSSRWTCDTRLPHDAARWPIARLAHRLNRPVFDANKGRVVPGYGVLQPCVSLTMTGVSRNPGSRTSSAARPASTPIRRPFPMLPRPLRRRHIHRQRHLRRRRLRAGRGEYVPGKPHSEPRFDRGRLADCGLVTDIELLDDFPTSYLVSLNRTSWPRRLANLAAAFAAQRAAPNVVDGQETVPQLGQETVPQLGQATMPQCESIRCRQWNAGKFSITCPEVWRPLR